MKKYILLAEEGERCLLEQVLSEDGGLLAAIADEWREAEVIYTGVGAINVIGALQGLDREAELLNIGYAGSANFDIGTWVEVSEARLNHPNVSYPEPEMTLSRMNDVRCTKAVCYTSTDFVLASGYKDCVFDMEIAFIAALGFRRLHSLKYVSDNLSLHAYHELTHGVE